MKRLLAFILIMLLALALSACSSDDGTSLVSTNDTGTPSYIDTNADIDIDTSIDNDIDGSTNADSSADTTVSTESGNENTQGNTSDDITDDSESHDDTSSDKSVSTSSCVNNHKFTETRTESTCYSHGSVKKVCSVCGKTTSQQLPLLDHTNITGYKQLNSTHHSVITTCAVCDHSTTTSASHNWNDWKTTSQPSKTEMGKKTRTCIDCGETSVENIPALEYSNSDINNRILELVNIERQKEGLSPLSYYTAGQSSADIRTAEIIELFSHTRPDGTSCFTVLHQAGINFYAAGENIAMGQRTPEEVMEDWMNSEGHRANILSESFTHIIVGYDASVNAWVQLFIGI